MASCVMCYDRKHREIKSGEQYIILDISSKLDCLYTREFTSSYSKDYIGRPGKGVTNSLLISTKRLNKKQKARFAITGITNQDFRKLFKYFKNSPYLG